MIRVITPVDAEVPPLVLPDPTTVPDPLVAVTLNESPVKPLTTVLLSSTPATRTPKPNACKPGSVHRLGERRRRRGGEDRGAGLVPPTAAEPVHNTEDVPTPVNPPLHALPSGSSEASVPGADVQPIVSPLSVDSASAPTRE